MLQSCIVFCEQEQPLDCCKVKMLYHQSWKHFVSTIKIRTLLLRNLKKNRTDGDSKQCHWSILMVQARILQVFGLKTNLKVHNLELIFSIYSHVYKTLKNNFEIFRGIKLLVVKNVNFGLLATNFESNSSMVYSPLVVCHGITMKVCGSRLSGL